MFGINSLDVGKTFLGAAIISWVWHKIWRFRDFLGDGKNFRGQKFWELENLEKFLGVQKLERGSKSFWGMAKKFVAINVGGGAYQISH